MLTFSMVRNLSTINFYKLNAFVKGHFCFTVELHHIIFHTCVLLLLLRSSLSLRQLLDPATTLFSYHLLVFCSKWSNHLNLPFGTNWLSNKFHSLSFSVHTICNNSKPIHTLNRYIWSASASTTTSKNIMLIFAEIDIHILVQDLVYLETIILCCLLKWLSSESTLNFETF